MKNGKKSSDTGGCCKDNGFRRYWGASFHGLRVQLTDVSAKIRNDHKWLEKL
jgi:hypothetical protein